MVKFDKKEIHVAWPISDTLVEGEPIEHKIINPLNNKPVTINVIQTPNPPTELQEVILERFRRQIAGDVGLSNERVFGHNLDIMYYDDIGETSESYKLSKKYPHFCFGCNSRIQYGSAFYHSKDDFTPEQFLAFWTLDLNNEKIKGLNIVFEFYCCKCYNIRKDWKKSIYHMIKMLRKVRMMGVILKIDTKHLPKLCHDYSELLLKEDL